MTSSEPTLYHPTLNCSLHGKLSGSTIQYRNVKYASIPERWKDSIPVNTLPTDRNGTFDATHFGPSCPQKRGSQAWDLTLVGDVSLPLEQGQGETEQMDEFECLHVNITVPRTTKQDGKLPVFVWVHGGALSMGANSWPQYDLRKFVERSMEIGKPIIAVGINYRVGVLGFLASEELGAAGNFGFKDQVLAFRWVKRHIGGFGGDERNITAAGESAGGISLSTLLCAEVGSEALFDRVAIMSGDATLRKPRTRAWHEMMYKEQLKFLRLEEMSKEQRVKRLREMDVEEMCERLPIAQHFCAVVDGNWLRGDVRLSALADGRSEVGKKRWCRGLVVGNTAHDGTVLKARILDNPHALRLLKEICSRHLSPSETRSLFSAYKLISLSSSSTSQQQYHSLLLLASELRFYLPALTVHHGWLTNALRRPACCYHFHITNPFDGAYKGLASHELDVAFLLQNFNHVFEDRRRGLAKGMANRFISLTYGERWCKDDEVVVFSDDGAKVVEQREYDTIWRGGRGDVLKRIGAERLWRVAEEWQGVRGEEPEKYLKAKL